MREQRKYLVVHQSPSQRFPRWSVMTYLGQSYTGEHQFSARPLAGTQTLPASWIKSTVPVDPATPHKINQRADDLDKRGRIAPVKGARVTFHERSRK